MDERKPKWLGESQQKTLEHHIQALDARIEKLKIQYNQFFAREILTPPEPEREALESRVRQLLSQEQRSPRINLLVQNVAAKFTLHNNRWLKRLHDLETDYHGSEPVRAGRPERTGREKAATVQEIDVSLNREDSFEHVFKAYRNMMVNPAMTDEAREKLINSLKSKMISANLVDARISISREEGKLRIRLKK